MLWFLQLTVVVISNYVIDSNSACENISSSNKYQLMTV